MTANAKKREFKKINRNFSSLAVSKTPTNSVPTLTAQTTILLPTHTGPGIDLNTYFDSLINDPSLSIIDKAVLELMLFYGLRISEALRISPNNVLQNGYLKIVGSKGSSDRLVFPHRYSRYWKNTLRASLPLSQLYSRFYFYRLFKRKGLYEKFNSNKNNSVTHFFRHKLLSSFKSSEVEVNTRKNFIGHKSERSTKYYE